MSIVHGTSNSVVCKLRLTEKFWPLKNFNDKHLLSEKGTARKISRKGVGLLVLILLYHFIF